MVTSRREKLEAMLADLPDDVFLRYALAVEYATDGRPREALSGLESLIQDRPDYVPAYFRAGQLRADAGDAGRARQVLQAGIAAAQASNDAHAALEMQALCEQLP